MNSNSEHTPEHNTGIFDSWEILSEDSAKKRFDKSFFKYNGSGLPKEIRWFFDAEDMEPGETLPIKIEFNGKLYSGRIMKENIGTQRTRIFWSTDLGKVYAVFQDHNNGYALFTKGNKDYYKMQMYDCNGELLGGGETKMTVKGSLESIKTYIESKGFSYEGRMIENFYLSLKSKPFVILAGTSGTGKTRLVKLFAEAIGAEYKMVPVRPDWSDSSDLFGHVDLNGRFVPGSVIDFVKRAELDLSRPYFLCLDEMNLARVEYYLSDILSVIETRDFHDDRIETDPLVTETYYGPDAQARGKYGEIRLPENLYIVGTVNMDETTFPFSRKVLDRANTIEFSYVDLLPKSESVSSSVSVQKLPNQFLKAKYLLLSGCAEETKTVNSYCSELQDINRILQKAGAHVGYRVRDEIVFYLLNNKTADLMSENEAFDYEIMQKILPRIQGSSSAIKDMLCELFKHCAGDYSGYQTENDNISAKMLRAVVQPNCRYRRSAEKIAFMVRRFEEDGFTSYWL